MPKLLVAAALTCALGLFVGACSKRMPRAKIDACALLTAEDMREVQNSPLTNKTGNQTSNGKVFISQCYFAADPAHQSISLAITQDNPDSKEADGARDYWHEIARHAEKKEEAEEDEEKREKRESLKEHEREEDEGAPLRKIDGVGDEAYWAGSRVGGALYVLKDDVIVRVSVGGPDNEETKIDKSKRIAAKALQRL